MIRISLGSVNTSNARITLQENYVLLFGVWSISYSYTRSFPKTFQANGSLQIYSMSLKNI